MKTRWMHLIAGLIMCVLCISVCTTTVNADLVWEDNFDDGTYEPEWTIFGHENDTSPVEIGGNFSAASGMLTVLDDDFNVARHNSTTNVGTWSFDMFVPDVVPSDGWQGIWVDFMSNGSYSSECGSIRNISVLSVGVYLGAGYNKFYFDEGLGSSWNTLRSYGPDVFQGWHHIDVSRNSTGGFLVAFNGTQRWSFTNYAINSSTYLQVTAQNIPGAAIDNLVVDDDPDKILTLLNPTTPTTTPTTPTPTPTTPTPIDPLLIGLFGGIGVGVVLIAIVYLRRR